MAVAVWLAEAKRQGVSLKSLASRSGVSERALREIVAGRTKTVNARTADRIATATDHGLWELERPAT